MPTLAIIDGVRIQMFYNDHAPAHFHAICADDEALISIESASVIRGSLPPAKMRRVLTWANDNKAALATNWRKCQDDQPPERIG